MSTHQIVWWVLCDVRSWRICLISITLPIVYPSHSQSQWILEQLMSENVDTSNCVLCILSHQELADTSDTNHTANRDGYKSSWYLSRSDITSKVACCVFCDMSHGVNSLTGSWLRSNIVALPIAMDMSGVDVCHDMRLPKVACCVFCDMLHLVNSLTGSWLRSNIALPIAMEIRGVDGSHERTLEYVCLQSHVVCFVISGVD